MAVDPWTVVHKNCELQCEPGRHWWNCPVWLVLCLPVGEITEE